MTHIPEKIPGLKWLTVLLGVYGVVWIGLEGGLWREVAMGVGVTAVSLLHLFQKKLGNQTLPLSKWLLTTSFFGLCSGLTSGPLTLTAMILKTGLHAHGPEFTLAEFHWVIYQIPLWTAVGFLLGVGLGLLAANHSK